MGARGVRSVDRRFTADQLRGCGWPISRRSNVGGFLYLAVVLDVFSRRIVGLVDGDDLAHAGGARRPQHGARAAAAERRDPRSDHGSEYPRSRSVKRCREAGVRPRWGRSETLTRTRRRRVSSRRSNVSCSIGVASKTQAEARMAVFNSSRASTIRAGGTSSLGYLSPVAFERRHQSSLSNPVHTSRPSCSAPVKERPGNVAASCTASVTAVRDSHSRRRRWQHAGRDEKMLSAEPKDHLKEEGQNAVKRDTLIPRPHLSTKLGQVQYCDSLRTEEVIVPDAEESHEHRQVAPERRGTEMFVDRVEPFQHGWK